MSHRLLDRLSGQRGTVLGARGEQEVGWHTGGTGEQGLVRRVRVEIREEAEGHEHQAPETSVVSASAPTPRWESYKQGMR